VSGGDLKVVGQRERVLREPEDDGQGRQHGPVDAVPRRDDGHGHDRDHDHARPPRAP
jgi:hypothetical protein